LNNEQNSNEKKNKFVQYGFWIIAGIAAAVAIFLLVSNMNNDSNSANVPDGYKFVVEDHYASNGQGWATYYVYDSYVIVRKDSESSKERPMMIYDVDTASLVYKENDTTKVCDKEACYDYPKVINNIKKLISKKTGREYIGQ